MSMVPHRYDNTARAAAPATVRARGADQRGALAPPPARAGGRAPTPPAPVSETAVSQADGEA